MYEAAITRSFSATHAIRLGDGSWEPSHGHDWQVSVTVAADRLDDIETVMDFHELENLVDQIIAQADRSDLNQVGPFADGRVSPTAERVAWWIGDSLSGCLPQGVCLARVAVTEAPGCVAAYIPSP